MKLKVVVSLIIFIIFSVSIESEALDSNVIETSRGSIEYSCQGQGIPVLVVHGIFGGVDHAIYTGNNLMGKDFKIIGVSRFGYLRSSLPQESTPLNQAKVYKELLDYLQLEEVVVLAVSAGGAPAINFALEYPSRTKALILAGSNSPDKREIKGPSGPPDFLLNDILFKIFLWKPFKEMMRSSLFGVEKETYKNASFQEKKQLDTLFNLLLPVKPRRPGIINDKKITNVDMNKNYDKYNLEDLQVPTLIFHAENDPLASFENANEMAKRIPEAKFVAYEDGGHILFGHQQEIQAIIKENIVK